MGVKWQMNTLAAVIHMDKKAVIIIPFYKDNISANEGIALAQCFKVLSAHHIVAIKPEKLVLPAAVTQYPFFSITSFDDSFFAGVSGYNRLMMSPTFYGAFVDYEYALIYQLDAFVFKDELLHWCTQGYDYIGAPWITPVKRNIFKVIKKGIQYYIHTRYNILENGLPTAKHLEYKVGNGGLSLRKTRVFYDLCFTQKAKIDEYNRKSHHYFNEDIFWSVEVNRKRRVLKKPGYREALKFSFEMHPERAFIINHQQLPFGCHAWEKYIDFWRPAFRQQGYDI